MSFKNKTDEEWKSQLGDESYYVTRQSCTERPFTGNIGILKKKGNTTVFAVILHCLNLIQSLIQVVAGQAFFFQKIKKQYLKFLITLME